MQEYKLHPPSNILAPRRGELNKSIEQESCNFALVRLMALHAANNSDALRRNLSFKRAYKREDIAERGDNQLKTISSHIVRMETNVVEYVLRHSDLIVYRLVHRFC